MGGRGARAHDPEDDEDGEEAEDVQEDDDAFEEGEFADKEGVEEDGEAGDGDDEEGCVPALDGVGGHGEGDERGELLGGNEADGHHAGLPAEHAEPADDVGEELLVLGRCKLGDPVVLTTGRRSHASHFGHGKHDEEHAETSRKEHPDGACRSTLG